MDVVVAHADTHGIGSNRHAFDHCVRVELHDVAVFAGAGLALIGIADQVLLTGELARHETPLQAGRETRAAASAQARLFDRGNHLVLGQAFATVSRQYFAQGLVSTARFIGRKTPITSIQIGQNLRLDMATVE